VIVFASPDAAGDALDGTRAILAVHGGQAGTHGRTLVGFTEHATEAQRRAVAPCG
jgi:hypothetical protein